MSVDASSAVCDVGGEGEVRQPQVLNVGVSEGVSDQLVKTDTREHGYCGVGQLQRQAPFAAHLLLGHRRVV